MARKYYDENGNVVKKRGGCFKWIGIGILVIIAISILASVFGGGEDSSTESAQTNTSEETSGSGDTTESSTDESVSPEETASLVESYNNIILGDAIEGGAGGTSIDDVVAVFGEPDSTSESSINGTQSAMYIWSNLEGGDIFSALTVQFTDGLASSKSVTGLPVDESDAVTADQFESIPIDGSYTFEQAVEELGQPDGYSESLLAGMSTNMVSWASNVDGDLGANFNITFQDGVAISKAQGGLQ